MKRYPYASELKGPALGTGNINLTNPLMKLYFSLSYSQAKKFKPILGTTKTKMTVKGYENADLGCYVIEPDRVDPNAPSIVYLHGGGFFGELGKLCFQNACFYANELKCKVFLPEYRTTFHFKFPIPIEDCYEATRYLVDHAKSLGLNKDRLVVYGDSAGGCLAAAVTLMARDRHDFSIGFQMLIYPVTDYLQTSESLKKYPMANWSAHANKQMWELYLDGKTPSNIGYASPLHAESLGNLPPAYVEPQEIDCLCDEGIAYAKRLEKAGVPTSLQVIPGSYHAFDEEFESPLVQRILKQRCEAIRTHFSRTNSGVKK